MYVVFRWFQSKEPMSAQIFAPQFSIIAPRERRCSKGLMDGTGQHGYRSDNASMTESRSVGPGPLPLLVYWALGEGTKLRFVRSPGIRGWALLGATAICLALPGAVTTLGHSALAGTILEERKLPMHFSWVACQPDCKGWGSAVGIVTSDSPKDFDEFARDRQLGSATIVLDSSGGSVHESIARRPRLRRPRAVTTGRGSVRDPTPPVGNG